MVHGKGGYQTVAHPAHHSVQSLAIAIDAMDIPAVRPFWKAVLGYDDVTAPADLVDPADGGPSLWFQQMDEPRTQRNRIHLDLTVPHDDAVARVEAALAAGGRLVSDDRARAFWILADSEGNEVCVCTMAQALWRARVRDPLRGVLLRYPGGGGRTSSSWAGSGRAGFPAAWTAGLSVVGCDILVRAASL